MRALDALILGVLQGLTEFLPVSSSGHLVLAESLLLSEPVAEPVLFTLVVHGGTALSTLVVFRFFIAGLFKDLRKLEWNQGTQYCAKVVISMVPAVVVGLLFEEEIEAVFDGSVALTGSMLCVTGGLLLFTLWARDGTGRVTYRIALVLGLAQAVAILPGISRSGATIATSLLLGMKKENATQFSFIMVLPVIFGSMAYKLLGYIREGGGEADAIGWVALLLGFVAAFGAGMAACRWMIRIVARSRLQYFAFYCFAVGLAAVIVASVR